MNYKKWIFSLIEGELKNPKYTIEKNYQIWCNSRDAKKVELRQAISYVLINKGHLTREKVGELLNKHHSSITASYQTANDLLSSNLAYDKPFRELVDELTVSFLKLKGKEEKGFKSYEEFYSIVSIALNDFSQSNSEDFYNYVSNIKKKFEINKPKVIV